MTNISGIDGSANPLRLPIDFEPDSRGLDPGMHVLAGVAAAPKKTWTPTDHARPRVLLGIAAKAFSWWMPMSVSDDTPYCPRSAVRGIKHSAIPA
jgi:hypothetical protein